MEVEDTSTLLFTDYGNLSGPPSADDWIQRVKLKVHILDKTNIESQSEDSTYHHSCTYCCTLFFCITRPNTFLGSGWVI